MEEYSGTSDMKKALEAKTSMEEFNNSIYDDLIRFQSSNDWQEEIP